MDPDVDPPYIYIYTVPIFLPGRDSESEEQVHVFINFHNPAVVLCCLWTLLATY